MEHSLAAKSAKSVFFESYNDIDIYVEDASRETRKLFSLLLTRAFGGKIRLDSVFPLGSRRSVLDACEADQAEGGRRRVYVIDGDLDLSCKRDTKKLSRLFRLPRYCIENYLVDGMAAASVLARESDFEDEEAVALRLKFDEWLVDISGPLKRLFLAFSVASILVPRMKTVSVGHSKIVKSDSGVVERMLVESMIVDVRNSVDLEHGHGAFDEAFNRLEYEHRMKPDVEYCLHFVSAKSFLLPLLKMRMNKVVRINRAMSLLKVNLAEFCDATELSGILSRAV